MTSRIHELLDDNTFLTAGGTETFLMFHQGVSLPNMCGFEIFNDEKALEAMEREYVRPIARAAANNGHGLLFDPLVWRASSDWVLQNGYGPQDVARINHHAVSWTRDALARWRREEGAQCPTILAADIGPRGDGYTFGDDAMTAEEARAYHSEQIGALADAGIDLIWALTMTNLPESIGIARAAADHGLPAVISPTVETDGRLPDGTLLRGLVEGVDDATKGSPVCYMVNCAHPIHVAPTLLSAKEAGEGWLDRFWGLRANASTKSHQELDESPTLDVGDPFDLAARMVALRDELGLRILGGCCGTDPRHITAIAEAAREDLSATA